MNSENKNSGIGCGALFVILLQITFIILRLCGVIGWSWIWVLSPAWIYVAGFLLLMSLLGILTAMLANEEDNKKK